MVAKSKPSVLPDVSAHANVGANVCALPPSIGYSVGLYGKTRTPCRAANSIHSDDNESNKKLKSLLPSKFQLLLLRNPLNVISCMNLLLQTAAVADAMGERWRQPDAWNMLIAGLSLFDPCNSMIGPSGIAPSTSASMLPEQLCAAAQEITASSVLQTKFLEDVTSEKCPIEGGTGFCSVAAGTVQHTDITIRIVIFVEFEIILLPFYSPSFSMPKARKDRKR